MGREWGPATSKVSRSLKMPWDEEDPQGLNPGAGLGAEAAATCRRRKVTTGMFRNFRMGARLLQDVWLSPE